MNYLISFLFGIQRRLTNIIRWNTTPKIVSESVASHSYFVTLYSMFLGDMIRREYGLDVDLEKVMRMALLHDVEESFSGDIVASLKVADKDFRKSLDNMCKRIVGEVFKDCKYDAEYVSLWEECREEKSIESKITSVSDILCQILYSYEEIRMGNQFMRNICENSLRLLQKKYNDKWIQDLYAEISTFLSRSIDIDLDDKKLYFHEFLCD